MASLPGSASVWPLEENFLCRQRAELVLGVGPRVDFKTWKKNSLFFIFGCAGYLLLRGQGGAFSRCRGWRLLFTAVGGLLVVVSSFVAGYRL